MEELCTKMSTSGHKLCIKSQKGPDGPKTEGLPTPISRFQMEKRMRELR